MKLSYVGEGFISEKVSVGDAVLSCVMGLFLQSYLRTTTSSHFCTCETMDGTHCNFAISKETLPPNSPAEDSPSEDSPVTMRKACWCKSVWFWLFRSVWMDQEQFTQGCSNHILPQKFNLCWPCRAKANLDQQWRRTKRTIPFARGFLEPQCFRWVFLSKEIGLKRHAMCSCV